jgi:K+-sensing histidine kinase KdpD
LVIEPIEQQLDLLNSPNENTFDILLHAITHDNHSPNNTLNASTPLTSHRQQIDSLYASIESDFESLEVTNNAIQNALKMSQNALSKVTQEDRLDRWVLV